MPDEVRRVARGRIDHALDELRGSSDSTRAEAVHEARKDMKKLRALLRLVRGELGDERLRRRERLLPRHRRRARRACATPTSCSRRSATWRALRRAARRAAAGCARRWWRTASAPSAGSLQTGVAGRRSRRSPRPASGSRDWPLDDGRLRGVRGGPAAQLPPAAAAGLPRRPGAAERRAHARVAQAGEGPLVPRVAAPGRLDSR